MVSRPIIDVNSRIIILLGRHASQSDLWLSYIDARMVEILKVRGFWLDAKS